ncbi:MAG: chemotaxis protein CheW [Pseudomonadota bacterium]|nr:chemotaxis protein CheW [Pseudomonadota bacterium]
MKNENINQAGAVNRVYPFEILAFMVGDEEYGIDIQQVRELRAYAPVTKIANSPPFIKGVVNLRGSIVSIVDMRIKFQLPASYDDSTVVIIINIDDKVTGIVVDRVLDVVSLEEGQIRAAPALGSSGNADYLVGLAVVQERMVLLMDLHDVLNVPPETVEKIAA